MTDPIEVARILDILGNRNRRRIIDLLRHKPCFVTEISDRLMISPKAVIDHLQMMEREEILSCHLDDRRRKYYYLANDISVSVQVRRRRTADQERDQGERVQIHQALLRLRRLVRAREEITASLNHLDDAIDREITIVHEKGGNIFKTPKEIDLAVAVSHYDLTRSELNEVTGIPVAELNILLDDLEERSIITQNGGVYRLCEAYEDRA